MMGLPGCRQQPAGLSELVEHTHVIRPIDGRMTYLRRGPQARMQPDDAVQQADLHLQTVSTHLARMSHVPTSKYPF